MIFFSYDGVDKPSRPQYSQSDFFSLIVCGLERLFRTNHFNLFSFAFEFVCGRKNLCVNVFTKYIYITVNAFFFRPLKPMII